MISAKVCLRTTSAKLIVVCYNCTSPGAVEDWDALECIWAHGFQELRASVEERPVILSESPCCAQQQREKMVRSRRTPSRAPVSRTHARSLSLALQLEILFETFHAPAVYLAKTPMLAACSVGRASAIVVDVGASCTRVSPVYDGYVLSSERSGGWGGGAL